MEDFDIKFSKLDGLIPHPDACTLTDDEIANLDLSYEWEKRNNN